MPIAKPQSPSTAAILSLLFPGMGFIYIQRPLYALFAFLGPLLLLAIMFVFTLSHPVLLALSVLTLISLQIFLVILSWRLAKSFGKANRSYVTHGAILGVAAVLLSLSFQPIFLPIMKTIARYIPVSNPSASMEPNLLPGDRFILNKHHFKSTLPMLGELAAFEGPEDFQVWYTKRIVGLPGDIIEIRNGVLYRNGGQENPSYQIKSEFPTFNKNEDPYHLYNYGPIKLESDQLFCLGDNRPNSLDCRTWGPIRIKALIGKPTYIYWSKNLTRIGLPLN